MPRNYKARPRKLWTDAALESALAERSAQGTTLGNLTKKYNIPKATLSRHLKSQSGVKVIRQQGRKSVFNEKETEELKLCVTSLASLGFALTVRATCELVESYINHSDHERAMAVFKHKSRKGYPGPDWLSTFLLKNNLSLKEATKLCVSRYNATKNPFLVYHFYDILEETMESLGIKDRPDLIWNCDESGLPHEPQKCRVVSAKGQKTLQVQPGFFTCIKKKF